MSDRWGRAFGNSSPSGLAIALTGKPRHASHMPQPSSSIGWSARSQQRQTAAHRSLDDRAGRACARRWRGRDAPGWRTRRRRQGHCAGRPAVKREKGWRSIRRGRRKPIPASPAHPAGRKMCFKGRSSVRKLFHPAGVVRRGSQALQTVEHGSAGQRRFQFWRRLPAGIDTIHVG